MADSLFSRILSIAGAAIMGLLTSSSVELLELLELLELVEPLLIRTGMAILAGTSSSLDDEEDEEVLTLSV